MIALLVSQAVIDQHRVLLASLDAAAKPAARSSARREFAVSLFAHADVEYELLYPRLSPMAREAAVDEHAVLRFAATRFVAATTQRSIVARARILREMLVHHIDREERVQLPALERKLGARASRALATAMRRRFAGKRATS